MSAEPPELGSKPSGPDFAPPSDGGSPNGVWPGQQPSTGPHLGASGPGDVGRAGALPRPDEERLKAASSRVPAIVTAVVIALVALIVIVASTRGGDEVQREQPGSAPTTPTPSALPPDTSNSITFSSHEGSGRLTVISHRWSANASSRPAYGAFLQLELRISVTEGQVSYGPQFFQSFDSSSNLFQTSAGGARPPLLGNGTLGPGRSVTGNIAFDMPRGDGTLLMTNALLESVTALRIAD